MLASLARENPRRTFLAMYTGRPTSITEISERAEISVYAVEMSMQPLHDDDLVRKLSKWELVSIRQQQGHLQYWAYHALTDRGRRIRGYLDENEQEAHRIFELLEMMKYSDRGSVIRKDGLRVRWKIVGELINHPEGLSTDDLMKSLETYVRTKPGLSIYLSSLRHILKVGRFGPQNVRMRYSLALSPEHIGAYETLEKLLQ